MHPADHVCRQWPSTPFPATERSGIYAEMFGQLFLGDPVAPTEHEQLLAHGGEPIVRPVPEELGDAWNEIEARSGTASFSTPDGGWRHAQGAGKVLLE